MEDHNIHDNNNNVYQRAGRIENVDGNTYQKDFVSMEKAMETHVVAEITKGQVITSGSKGQPGHEIAISDFAK